MTHDQVAKLIGVDDGSDQVTWKYDQRTGTGGIEVRIESQ